MSRRKKNNRRKNRTRSTNNSSRSKNQKNNTAKIMSTNAQDVIQTERVQEASSDDVQDVKTVEVKEKTIVNATDDESKIEPILSVDDLESDDIVSDGFIDDDEDEEDSEFDDEYDDLDDETYDDIQDNILISNDGNGVIRSSNDLTDSLITYETEGFIDPNTNKPYNRFHLMAHPIKLVFKQHTRGDDPDDYETVGFVVNRAFAYEMSDLFDNIRRAYDGQPLDRKDRVKEELTPDNIRRKFMRLIRNHPVQAGMTVLVILAIIVILFFV